MVNVTMRNCHHTAPWPDRPFERHANEFADEQTSQHRVLGKVLEVEAENNRREALRQDDGLVTDHEAEVKFFHDKGILVRVWTVNKRSRAEHLFNLGVDMVMSDYPEKIGIV